MVKSSWFRDLVGENLSGVTFVQDYIQLQFNPPLILNVYTPLEIATSNETVHTGDERFANTLIRQINRVVTSVDVVEDIAINIRLDDGSSMSISLKQSDYEGPEAFTLFDSRGGVRAE